MAASKPMHVWFRSDQHAKLLDRAKKKGQNISVVIRAAIDAYLLNRPAEFSGPFDNGVVSRVDQTFYITAAQYEKLRAISRKEDISQSTLIREAVCLELKR